MLKLIYFELLKFSLRLSRYMTFMMQMSIPHTNVCLQSWNNKWKREVKKRVELGMYRTIQNTSSTPERELPMRPWSGLSPEGTQSSNFTPANIVCPNHQKYYKEQRENVKPSKPPNSQFKTLSNLEWRYSSMKWNVPLEKENWNKHHKQKILTVLPSLTNADPSVVGTWPAAKPIQFSLLVQQQEHEPQHQRTKTSILLATTLFISLRAQIWPWCIEYHSYGTRNYNQ